MAKDEHKLSCAHMTIFTDGTKERLHGHNFHVGVTVEYGPCGPDSLLDFAKLKAAVAGICLELKEHLLIPGESPHVQVIRRDAQQIELEVCSRRYVLPSDEVKILPVPNVVVEHLASYVWAQLAQALAVEFESVQATSMDVTVTESNGQGAGYAAALPFGR